MVWGKEKGSLTKWKITGVCERFPGTWNDEFSVSSALQDISKVIYNCSSILHRDKPNSKSNLNRDHSRAQHLQRDSNLLLHIHGPPELAMSRVFFLPRTLQNDHPGVSNQVYQSDTQKRIHMKGLIKEVLLGEPIKELGK